MRLMINGQAYDYTGDPETPLLWVLREHFRLTGTKYGCGIALCGACTVHLDGRATRSCVTPAKDVKDAAITTIEGISGKVAEAVQSAWQRLDVPQCGYCQSGQIMSAVSLLSETPKPTDEDIDSGMTGNVCRCATYHRIRAAIHEAARGLEG